MRRLKKILTLVLVAVMMMAMSSVAFASTLTINSTADTDEAAKETTAYKAWKLLDADIAQDDPTTEKDESGVPTTTLDGEQSGGAVAYYTTSSAVVDALSSLFDFVQVGETGKYYATAKDSFTSADQVTSLLGTKSEAELTELFGAPATGAQTAPGERADIEVSDGYYYITSTLGDKIAVLTVGDTKINTKNSYPTQEKELKNETTDAHVQIGDDVTYTLTVNIPASANDYIVLTDVMDDGLTFKSIDATFSSSVAYTFAPEAKTAEAVTANDNTFTLTIAADDVKAHQGETLTIDYVATVNNKAVVAVPEKNTVTLDYGQHYTSVSKEVETVTHSFSFDKVDGTTALSGAEFILTTDGSTAIDLVEVTAGEVYRVWMEEDGEAAKIKDGKIVTIGKTVTINGVDSDVQYKLVETKAPAGGYNKLEEPKTIDVAVDNTTHIDVENNKGSVLPSTGGIGTTIFYIIGAVLVIGAGVVIVTKRRMDDAK